MTGAAADGRRTKGGTGCHRERLSRRGMVGSAQCGTGGTEHKRSVDHDFAVLAEAVCTEFGKQGRGDADIRVFAARPAEADLNGTAQMHCRLESWRLQCRPCLHVPPIA